MAVDQRHLGENLPNGFQSLTRRRQERELPIRWTWADFAHPGADREYDHACSPHTALAATLSHKVGNGARLILAGLDVAAECGGGHYLSMSYNRTAGHVRASETSRNMQTEYVNVARKYATIMDRH